ncbi:retrovirus-related pol polyprotein from transposon TNT 1-94 [Tanacetum coccineum]
MNSDIKERCHGPSDAMHNPSQPFKWQSAPASKYQTDGLLQPHSCRVEFIFQHAHTQATKTYYKHQDSRIKKAQELNTKTSANSDIQDYFLKEYQDYQEKPIVKGRLFASFQMMHNMSYHLSKFDGKADEGFFVGYSLNSKAFRVFNSRTRIVEENLHIRFSESTPNVVGSGPDWLFDIDALTRTMNYEPIVAGTQSNGFADPKSSHDDGSKPLSDDGKKVDEDLRKDSKCNDQEKEDNVNSTNNVNAASTNEVNVVGGKTSIELSDDPNMPTLEDYSIFDFIKEEKVKMMVCTGTDINNLDTTIQALSGGFRNKKDERGIVIRNKARLVAQGYTQEEGIDYDEVFAFVIKEEVYGCSTHQRFEELAFLDRVYKGLKKHYEFYERTYILLRITSATENRGGLAIFISQIKYVKEILKKFGFTEVKTASTPMETQKPLLKDEDGKEVDVHMYRSMIGSLMYLTSSRPDIMFVVCACARYQVNPKVSHLHAVKKIFRYLKGQPKLGLWYPKDSPFDLVAYTDSDYAGASLERNSTIAVVNFFRCSLISWQRVRGDDDGGVMEWRWGGSGSRVGDFRRVVESVIGDRVDPLVGSILGLRRKNPPEKFSGGGAWWPALRSRANSSNITKTRSKATPNESSSLGTTLGGGPRCQETMRDTIAQTKFENVSKHSNDSLLTRDNTLRSDNDRLKLNELMELCTTLQNRVLDLEKTKTTQQNEIDSLKRRVKKLKKIRSSRTHKLKRLYKVDEEINLAQALEALKTSKPKVKGIVFQEPSKSTTTTIISSQQSQDKGKGIMIEEPVKPMIKKDQISFDEEEKIDVDYQLVERLQAKEQEKLFDAKKAILLQQLLEKRRKHFAAKRAEAKRNKPPTKAQQKKIMCTYLKNMEGYKLNDLKFKDFNSIQEMFDRAFKRVNTFEDFITELVEGKEKRVGAELVQESTKKQNVEDDKEIAEIKKLMEIIPDEEEVAIDDIPLAIKSPSIVDWKIHKEGRKAIIK